MAIIDDIFLDGDRLIVEWRDGAASCIPALWLRHNCDCEACLVRQTDEKRFQIFDVPADWKPSRATLAGGDHDQTIDIEWPDGHRSRFHAWTLYGLLQPAPRRLRLWDSAFRPRRFDFDEFLRDDRVAAETIDEFLATGACVFTDAPTTPASVEQLASRLGPVREVVFERIHNVRTDPSGYNIAHTKEYVPPHNDMVSYAWPPSVQALHMLVNACQGGDTEIVDGFAVLQQLREEQPWVFDVLCAVPVPFRQFNAEYETWACEPTIELDSAGDVKLLRFSNQLMQAVPLHEPRLAEFYPAFRDLAARINAEEAKARLRLEAGDVLLTAGHRVLHARTALTGMGERHLQDAYFEHDNVRNHLTVLRRRLGENEVALADVALRRDLGAVSAAPNA